MSCRSSRMSTSHQFGVSTRYSFNTSPYQERLAGVSVVVPCQATNAPPPVVVREKSIQTVVAAPPRSPCPVEPLQLTVRSGDVYGLESISWSCRQAARSCAGHALKAADSCEASMFPKAFGVPLRTPTKQDPLSDRMDAGVPNARIACLQHLHAAEHSGRLLVFEHAVSGDASRGIVQVRDQVQIPHAEVLHDIQSAYATWR